MAKKIGGLVTVVALLALGIPLLAGEAAPPTEERPTYRIVSVDGELPTTTEGLIALLNEEDVDSVAMCGGQCGDGTCICTGSDDCCDDLCEYGCSLCSDPPCVVIADDVDQ